MTQYSNIKLSIIVPVYKVELYIMRFLQSLLDQDFKYKDLFEVVFVDDCGGDNSIHIIEELLSISNINYHIISHEVNLGVSAARNTGLSVAIGDYIYWADSDDILEKNTVANIFEAIDIYPKQRIFYFNARHKNIDDNDLQEWPSCDELKKEMCTQDFLKLMYQGKVGAYLWEYLFHKEIFRNLKFTEGAVWEDAIIFPSILSSQNKIVCFSDKFIYQYILRSESITQSVHPQIDNVIPSLNQLEMHLYPLKKEDLYRDFIFYRTRLTMILSRECFIRTKNFRRLMDIHRIWGKNIPQENINVLWKSHKKRSAIFLELIKVNPSILYFLYSIKILK